MLSASARRCAARMSRQVLCCAAALCAAAAGCGWGATGRDASAPVTGVLAPAAGLKREGSDEGCTSQEHHLGLPGALHHHASHHLRRQPAAGSAVAAAGCPGGQGTLGTARSASNASTKDYSAFAAGAQVLTP